MKNTKPKVNEYFGILYVGSKGMYSLVPCKAEEDKKETTFRLEYNLSYTEEIAKGIFPEDYKMPLIFKKLEGNFAQEILTGTIFHYGIESMIYNLINADAKKAGLIAKLEEIGKCPIILSSMGPYPVEVDENFKILYAEETLSKKEEVIEKINSLVNTSSERFTTTKEEYDRELQEEFERIIPLAKTENVLFDFERKSLVKKHEE